MGYDVTQSGSDPLVFLMVDSADHITGKTGISPTVTISKNGGAFAAPAGSVTEIANGWYKLDGAADKDTLGPLILHATGAGADDTDEVYSVVREYTLVDVQKWLNVAVIKDANDIPSVNVVDWAGDAVATPVALGIPRVDILYWRGDAVPASANIGVPTVDVLYWRGDAVPVPDHTGEPLITVHDIQANAVNSGALASSAVDEITSSVLKTDWTGYTGEARHSVLNALRKLANHWEIVTGTLTVYKEDGTTPAYTQTIVVTAGADPITELD